MNSPSVNLLKLLEAAAKFVGGEKQLAERLGIQQLSLRRLMAELDDGAALMSPMHSDCAVGAGNQEVYPHP